MSVFMYDATFLFHLYAATIKFMCEKAPTVVFQH